MARLFFGLGCGMSLVAAAVFGGLKLSLQPGMRSLLVVSCVALAAAFVLAVWLLRRLPLKAVVLAIGWSTVTVIVLTAIGLGEGVRSLGLGFFGLVVCLVTVITSLRAGLLLVLGCAMAVVGLGWAEAVGLLHGVGTTHPDPHVFSIAMHFMLLTAAVVAGSQMSRVIDERVATEAQLRRSQAMLSHLFATSPDFITLSDLETDTYVMVNDSFTRMFGYAAGEVVGRSALDLGIWHQPDDRRKMVHELRTRGGVNEVETLFVHKSGETVTLMMSAGMFSMDGRAYLVINGRDVTEMQRTRLEHEAILKNASIGIALTRGRCFMQVNPSFERMFGWEPGELVGKPGTVVWENEAACTELRHLAGPLLRQGKPVEVERQMKRHDGSLFWCRLLAQVVDPGQRSMGGTIWIAEDVTERRQIEQALAAARDVAEAASRAKSAFLANTSHEIRTPLNGLLGLANLAMQPELDERRRQQYLAQIHDSAQSLAGIISDIFDLSKIEAGKFSIEAVPFHLHGLLKAVHHAYGSLAAARSLQLLLDVADEVPAIVLGDPVRLRQILGNYITNGLKFTERGRVRLQVTRSPDPARPRHLRFTVSDTGPGIDEAMQQRLFQPFTQADDSTTRRFGGTGVGLSICKELATLMEGEVGVDSAPGAGSRFWAELPLPEAELPVADPRAEAEDVARLAGLRVLLVEDNPVNMMIGVAMLEQWGVEVTQATDGAEGVAAVKQARAAQRPFHIVLMDVQMPRLSGHEAARQMRLLHSAAELPIIALTAAALASEREKALAAGMTDFLTKPIDVHRLRAALVRALG